jgi:ribosomal protein L31E
LRKTKHVSLKRRAEGSVKAVRGIWVVLTRIHDCV